MAATAVANAARKSSSSVPPPSSFAELLRRSKFATYDPSIRQTYVSAPANAHRGDWGLKRPISLRRKNAFISLASFEHSAQFAEWNNAENEVRFIRRVEEMGVTPKADVLTPWYKSLGDSKTDFLTDSDFCSGERSMVSLKKEKDYIDLDTDLGGKGPGKYGKRRVAPEGREIYVAQNVNAMSKKEFKRYLRTIRGLRPVFQEYINSHVDTKNISTNNLHALSLRSQEGLGHYHRKFLKEHMKKEFQDIEAKKIEPQPHPNGALMYARPTSLESVLWTNPQPGIILHKFDLDRFARKHIASFGGITAFINKDNLGLKEPLLDVKSEDGIERDPERQNKSLADMRIVPGDGISLKVPPKVVGHKPEGLEATKLVAEVKMDVGRTAFLQQNPYAIGSREYITNSSRWSAPPRSFVPQLEDVQIIPPENGVSLISTVKTILKFPHSTPL